jgi:cytoskeletal protein CcmA (bactofilin family)
LAGLTIPAFADVYCPPRLGPVTIDDNVIVTGTCVLNGTRVKGNVLVQSNGALTVHNKARIEGNIQADGGVYVRVLESTRVGGDIQLKGLSGRYSYVKNSTIGGNLQMENNRIPLLAEYNFIDGDLQAFSNTGGVTLRFNTIDGNLQCKSNRPAPTGGHNRVSGNKEDQCARL